MYLSAIEEEIPTIFITDENFYRNKNCREILRMMARIREETGSDIRIMFQCELCTVDNHGEIDREFMDLCEEAGCFMIFFGQESFNPEILKNNMDKTHNLRHIARSLNKNIDRLTEQDIVDYTKMFIAEWKERGVAVNYTCLIGLEGDKPGMGKKTAERAIELDADFISPYIFSLLPGSRDYENFVTSENAEQNRKNAGIKKIDTRFNNADSYHPNVEYENGLTFAQQKEEFNAVMKNFYRVSRAHKNMHPSILAYYLLHCLAAVLEEHPMSLGLFRRENTERALKDVRRNEIRELIRK